MSTSLPEWMEQAATIYADPCYQLMAEEGDESEDDAHPALREQEQYIIRDQLNYPVVRTGTEEGNSVSEDAVASVFAKTLKTLKRSKKSFEDKLQTLVRMGMDQDEAIDALCSDSEE